MNIAFDIDGVLTDVGAFQLKEGKRFFKDRKIVDEKAYGIREIFGCTAKEEYAFWRKNILSYSLKFPARVGCGEMIAKIKEEGNNIFIISSRIKTASNDMIGWLMRRLVYRFLRKYGIPYDQINFCSIQNSAEEKSQVCRNNKIDIMIEDCPENINALKQVTQVICFDCEYNRKLTDVYRVNNFYEVYEYVNKKNKNVKFKYKKEKRKAIGCVFVDRSNKDSQILAKEQLIKIVLYGGNIIIFPEGTRNRTDEALLEFKLGAVAIAQITGMPIVPIAIIRKSVDNREKIRLKAGEEIYISYNDDLVVENARLRDSIKQMLEKN